MTDVEKPKIPVTPVLNAVKCVVCDTPDSELSVGYVLLLRPNDDRESSFAICYLCDTVMEIKSRVLADTVLPPRFRVLVPAEDNIVKYQCPKCGKFKSRIPKLETDSRNICLYCGEKWIPVERLTAGEKTARKNASEKERARVKRERQKSVRAKADLNPNLIQLMNDLPQEKLNELANLLGT